MGQQPQRQATRQRQHRRQFGSRLLLAQCAGLRSARTRLTIGSPDNVADGGDTFVEIQAITVTLNLEGWTVKGSNRSSVELASLELGSEAITNANRYYVIFGHDLGV